MALPPVDAELQLDGGAAGQQPQAQPQRAVAAATPPDQLGAQGAVGLQLGTRLPGPRQRMVAVIGGDVPGIPELALVAPAAPAQRCPQQRAALGIPELLQAGRAAADAHQAVAQLPALFALVAEPDGMRDRQRRLAAVVRRHGGTPQRQGADARRQRQLQPDASLAGGLARQEPSRLGTAGEPPVAGGQASAARCRRQGLQLRQPPGLVAAVPCARRSAWCRGGDPAAAARLGRVLAAGRGAGGHGLGCRQGAQAGQQGQVALSAGLAPRGAPFGFRLLEHLRNRGAGEDVVELLEQQRPPVNRRHRGTPPAPLFRVGGLARGRHRRGRPAAIDVVRRSAWCRTAGRRLPRGRRCFAARLDWLSRVGSVGIARRCRGRPRSTIRRIRRRGECAGGSPAWGCGRVWPAHRLQQRPGQFRLAQQSLERAVVAFLVGAAGGTAPVQFQVQLIAPDRQPRRQWLQLGQVLAQAAVAQRRHRRLPLPQRQLLQHLGGGPAAVIAHPRQPEQLVDAADALPVEPLRLDRQRVAVGADRRRHQRQQFCATAAAPAEQPMGEGLAGVPGQLVGAEPAHAREAGDRGQARGEAEAVGQPGQLVPPFRQGPAAVALPQLKLSQQRGRLDQLAVALDPGPVQRLPAPLAHRGADAREQRRPVLLQPGVERRRGVAEAQLRPAFHQRQRRVEGALGRLPGVGYRPQPGQIQVGMTEHPHRAVASAGRQPPLGAQGLQFRYHRLQQAEGIGRIAGLQFEPAVDQGAIVMAGADQEQLQLQRLALPPALRQGPAAGGVEQVAAVHADPIDVQLGGLGPPAQAEARHRATRQVGPVGGPFQSPAQPPLLAAPGPDDQPARRPVGPVQAAPRILQGAGAIRPRRQRLPEGLEIEAGRQWGT